MARQRSRRWTRRAALAVVAILLLGALGVIACRPSQEIDLSDYNLLVITIDTLRADRLGAYGYEAAETPNLDSLANDGARFENSFSSVPLTLPSHSTLFTGRYPNTIGVRTNGTYVLGESEVTLAEVLRDRGFETYAALAAFVLASKFGLAQGFNTYDDRLGTKDVYQVFDSEIDADQVYRKFNRWLGDRGTARFFSWVHFYDPHLPYQPPQPYADRFRDNPYDGEIAYVDFYVGKMLDDLRTRGLLDKTLVVVTSDHGDAFGEHGEEGHGLLCYNETLRVPLILYAPGQIGPGQVYREPVGLVDLMPTLLDLLSGPEDLGPSAFDGRSFAPSLRGDTVLDLQPIYFESMAGHELKGWAPVVGIMLDQHKFIDVPIPELYDLDRDPGERRNLYRQKPEIAERLEQALESLLDLESPPADVSNRRELSAEDRRKLRALGYLTDTSSAVGGETDPKVGIAVEMSVRSIRATINSGALDEAEQALDRLLAENPGLDTPDIYDLRYSLAAERGQADAAIQALEDGRSTHPELEVLRFKLALYLFNLGRFSDSRREALALLEINPDQSQAMVLLGRIAEAEGQLDQALSYFERATVFEPQSIPLQIERADLLARAGQVEAAFEIYQALVADGVLDRDADALYKAAMLSTRVGRLDQAESWFRRGLEQKPAGIHHLTFAFVLYQQGKKDEAIGELETALGQYGDELTPQQTQLAAATLGQWRAASR